MAKTWDLIVHNKTDGYYNMAFDEAMVTRYLSSRVPMLRIYGWDKPFITIGYNQDPREALLPGDVPFTRRITGGAAILHHDEITYSFVCSPDDLGLAGTVKDSYRKICRALIFFISIESKSCLRRCKGELVVTVIFVFFRRAF